MRASIFVKPGTSTALAALMALALAGCGKSGAGAGGGTNSTSSSGSPLTAPVDYIKAVGDAKIRSMKTIDLAQVRHAIQMFNAAEDRNPKDLNELVQTHYLGEVPEPPVGTKLVYNPDTGDVDIVQK